MFELLLVARLIVAAVFVAAGLTKLVDPQGSRASAGDFGVPGWLTWVFVWVLPLAELAAGAALIPAGSAVWGATGALGMLALFVGGMGVSLARGRKPDCHCFGKLYSRPISAGTLVRESALAGLAGLVVWQGPGDSVGRLWGALSGVEAGLLGLAAGLAGLAGGGVWLALQVLEQNGRLLRRLEAVEEKLGVRGEDALVEPEPGLAVNNLAPAFRVETLQGRAVTLDTLEAAGRPVLLVFSEPGCGACEKLLPELAESQRGHALRLEIALVSSGGAAANLAKAEQYGLENVVLQKGEEVSELFGVTGTPSAVLIRDGKIGSALAVGPDAIRTLLGRATLPPQVKRGERVPELRFPDLSGSMTDLAKLGGRRTVLLFWNPSCGFCQQLLEGVKGWESRRDEDAPELVVISAGSLEENRAQGFRSRVLLDQNFGAGHVFDAEGTPAAVLIDEDGRVASAVAVGGPNVLALAESSGARGRRRERVAEESLAAR